MIVGYLAHSFDLLNVRDLDAIAQAAARCDRLVVGVLADRLVEQRYGRAPIVPLVERLALVAQLRGVDAVVEQPTAALPAGLPDVTAYVVAGEPPVLDGVLAVVLTPRQQTASEVLRLALRTPATTDEAVA